MRFAFDEDQLAFRDAVRGLLAKQCPAEVVRAAWPDDGVKGAGVRAPGGRDALRPLWESLAEMGALGIAAPERVGGLGLGALDWVLLAEEGGYAALPLPFVESAVVAAPLLTEVDGFDEVVSEIIAGRLVVAARLLGDRSVPHAVTAGAALVLDEHGALVWVASPGDAPGSTVAAPIDSVDGARALGLVDVRDGRRVTDDPAVIDRAFDRGALGTAAALVGLARRMLDLTVGYVKDRHQFGVPIGSFQAVKHHLADALQQVELTRPAVARAAWSLATGAETATRDVSMAKVMASDAARFVGRQALQCHGAIGYTVEYDLHLYLKRAWALAADWGDAGWHRQRLALALGV